MDNKEKETDVTKEEHETKESPVIDTIKEEGLIQEVLLK